MRVTWPASGFGLIEHPTAFECILYKDAEILFFLFPRLKPRCRHWNVEPQDLPWAVPPYQVHKTANGWIPRVCEMSCILGLSSQIVTIMKFSISRNVAPQARSPLPSRMKGTMGPVMRFVPTTI